MLYYIILLRSTKENAVVILCWVSCVIQPEKIKVFSVMGRVDANLAPPPPPPKIFAGAYSQPETGMDFGLAFMMPRPQTVNLAYKNTSAGEHGFCLRYFVYFLGVF